MKKSDYVILIIGASLFLIAYLIDFDNYAQLSGFMKGAGIGVIVATIIKAIFTYKKTK